MRTWTSATIQLTWDDAVDTAYVSCPLNTWHDIMVSWDTDIGLLYLLVDGVVMDIIAISASSTTPGSMFFGDLFYEWAYEAYFDQLRVLNACLLPYGAYFTGNGAVDTDVAHEDITFYDPLTTACATPRAPAIGGGTITYLGSGANPGVSAAGMNWANLTDDAVELTASTYITGDFTSESKGSISFEYIANAALPSPAGYIIASSNYHHFGLIRNNDGSLQLNICGEETDGAPFSWDTNKTYFIKFDWHVTESGGDQTIVYNLYIDGVLYLAVDETNTSAISFPANLYIGNKDENDNESMQGTMKNFYITNNPNTPQIPVVLGQGPIYAPIQEIT